MIWALTGFMGCGKTSAGRLAAGISGGALPFTDLDEEIARREGRSIPDIFAAVGEKGFREMEFEALSALLSAAPTMLLSLGGGTLTYGKSLSLVQERCRCIYLRARVETLADNLRHAAQTSCRPLLAGADPDAPANSPESLESRITAMMAARAPIYENTADFIIDTDGLQPEKIAGKILEICRREG